MNPLLIGMNAKFIHPNNALRLLKANASSRVDIKEFTIKDAPEDILSYITTSRPLFVGFSCYIWNIEILIPIIRTLKETTDIPIVLGGPEVSYDAKHFIETLDVDVVVKGEGEAVIDAIIAYFKHGDTALENMPGIQSRTLDTPIKEISDLSTLKSPHIINIDDPAHKIHYIESSRGCPYRCTYCLSSLEKTVRFFPVKAVTDDIIHCQRQGAKTFKFLDRTFNANPRALDIIDFIIRNHQPNMSFQFEITGEILNQEIVDYIHKHAPKHLFRFEIGIQSTNAETNRLVERLQDNERLKRTIRNIIDHDVIDLHLDLIAGLPKEDLPRFKQTFNEIYALGAKELQLGFLKMLRGTKIRNQADLHDYEYEKTAPYEIKKNNVLSERDIERIKKVETVLNLFHNKNYFGDTFFNIIRTLSDDYFTFFECLYQDYVKNHPLKGYQLETLYAFLTSHLQTRYHLEERQTDPFKYTYLKRAKVKPKTYFDRIEDRRLKQKIFETINFKTELSLNTLYKHSIITEYQEGYLVAHYQNQKANLFILNSGDLSQ